MSRNRLRNAVAIVLLSSAAMVGAALAAPPCGTPPCKGGGGGDTAGSNNLSFPVIFSDGVGPIGTEGESYTDISPTGWTFYDGPWTDNDGDGFYDQCVQSVPVGSPVPDNFVCYQTEDQTVWWLQERAVNKWQAFDPRNVSDPLEGIDMGDVIVTAVDWGDLLESSPSLNARKVRTEVWLLKDVPVTGEPLSPYLADMSGGSPDCPSGLDECLVAFQMSGAVPGTEQSINEVQGTDFGADTGDVTGTGAFIDPASVKYDDDTSPMPRGYEATMYSKCARLFMQSISDPEEATYDAASGHWTGTGAGAVVQEISAQDGSYSAEINAGGFLIYGYNWNAKTAIPGTYRLTFVLDGPDSGNACPDLKTYFDATTQVFVTPSDAGEPPVQTAVVLPNCGKAEGTTDCVASEGGLTYVDVLISKAAGGGGPK
jgi:hypothetical protein